jgi:hypothetical protein
VGQAKKPFAQRVGARFYQGDAASTFSSPTNGESSSEAVNRVLEHSGALQRIASHAEAANRVLDESGALKDIVRIAAQAQEALREIRIADVDQIQIRDWLAVQDSRGLEALAHDVEIESVEPVQLPGTNVQRARGTIDQLILTLLLTSARLASDVSPDRTRNLILDALAVLLVLRAILTAIDKDD